MRTSQHLTPGHVYAREDLRSQFGITDEHPTSFLLRRA